VELSFCQAWLHEVFVCTGSKSTFAQILAGLALPPRQVIAWGSSGRALKPSQLSISAQSESVFMAEASPRLFNDEVRTIDFDWKGQDRDGVGDVSHRRRADPSRPAKYRTIMVNNPLPSRLCVNPRWLTAFISGLNLPPKIPKNEKSPRSPSTNSCSPLFCRPSRDGKPARGFEMLDQFHDPGLKMVFFGAPPVQSPRRGSPC
jgi:hypothetical protein